MGLIDDCFESAKITGLDIREHLETLKRYSLECEHITELGVRSIVSTWAFLAARPKRLVSVDIYHPSYFGANLDIVYSACKEEGIDFEFIQKSSLEIELEPTDLLFIDTLHIYSQLSQELSLHADKAKKYIILHDTESCKEFAQDPKWGTIGGLGKAVTEFLSNHLEWDIKEVYTNNNGLTVLERKFQYDFHR